jgi:phosphatidylethanolamine/phosphatidyl-N-methylethanolamine N-methyltransferase
MMDKRSIEKVYKAYSSVYDRLFGRVLENGRIKIITLMNLNGHEKVLEVGIGTGLSLNKYPATTNIIGIDLSKSMLKKAKEKITKYNLKNIDLQLVDAEEMIFPENTFDRVIIMYTLSVTPNPKKLLEMSSHVCKEGGEIFIVNHFSHNTIFRKFINEKYISTLETKLGFRMYFPLQDCINHIKYLGYNNISVKGANFGLSKIIHIKK